MKRRLLCGGLVPAFVLGLVGARSALADAPPYVLIPTSLTYIAPENCPDEQFFRSAFITHTGGQDPFTPTGAQSLTVKIARKGGLYVLDVRLVDAAGKPFLPHGRPFDRPAAARCSDVVEGAGMIATSGIKHYTWDDPAPPQPAAPAPAPPPAPAPDPPSRSEIPPDDLPPPAPPPKPTPTPIVWRVGVYGSGEWDYVGVATPAPRFTASVGGRHDTFSGAIQVAWDPVVTTRSQSVGAVSGGVALCGHVEKLFVPCGLAEVSEVQFFGTSPMAPGGSLTRAAIGGRLSADVPLPIVGRHVFIVPALDGLFTFGRPLGEGALKLSSLTARIGAGLLVELGSP